MILFLKIVMFFIAAVWGAALGIAVPVTLLVNPELSAVIPVHAPLLWLTTAVVGYVLPCFLVRFGKTNVAAALSLVGAVGVAALTVVFARAAAGFGLFYLPLLAETAAVCAIALISRRKVLEERHNAPAESILGDVAAAAPGKSGGKSGGKRGRSNPQKKGK